MSRLPQLTGAEMVKALESAGFVVVRVRGSHHRMRHGDGRVTAIPVHKGETLGPGLILKILRDVEMDRQQLQDLLR